MKKYQKYKSTNIDWIGDIPNTWNIIPFKRLTQIKRGASPRPIDDPIYFDENGEFGWVRIADVTASDRYLENTTQKLSELGASLSVKRYPGDLFLSIAGTVGKPIISKIKCCIHDGFVWFPDLKINPEFFYYIFSAGLAYQGLGKLGTQLNLNTDTVGYINLPLPSKEEICQIVKYLDKTTEKIDSLVSKKQKLIELLKEERTAIINQAVTKGIDPNVEMKDTEIEWLGKIPKQWKVKKIRFLVTLINEEADGNDNMRKIAVESNTGKIINLGNNDSYGDKGNYFHKDDVLFNKLRPYLAKVYKANDRGICIGELLIFRARNEITSDFLFYRLVSESFISEVNSSTYGTKMPRASWDFIRNLKIGLPDKEEQGTIVQHIIKETKKIDHTISRIQKEIDLLQEYRTALISEVVTGKIDVRQEVVS